MQISRRHGPRSVAVPMRRQPDPVRYRLRTRDWEFFVDGDVEAFAVLARHDIEEIDVLEG